MKPVTINGASIRLAPANLERIVDLRHRLLREGLPRETAIFPGDELPTTLHFAATNEEGKALCCLTLLLSEWEGKPAWQLRGMATEPAYQRTGIGRELVHYATRHAALSQRDIGIFWCNARVTAAGFYEKLGWRRVSEEFVIPTAGPHVKMTWKQT
jgi:GNAT superfamily N-acetyltransferase